MVLARLLVTCGYHEHQRDARADDQQAAYSVGSSTEGARVPYLQRKNLDEISEFFEWLQLP